ncbi:MAG: PilT/PilU family type 4a pilus ATPase [Polyangiaceae bacterium]
MAKLDDWLAQLLRPDVSELAVATDRIPCVRVDGQFSPVASAPIRAGEVELFVLSVGGATHLPNLGTEPTVWTFDVEGVGSVTVGAISKGGGIQARFVLKERAPNAVIPELIVVAVPKPEPRPAPKPRVRVAAKHSTDDIDLGGGTEDDAIAAAPALGASEPFSPSGMAAVAAPVSPVAALGDVRSLDELLKVARDVDASDLHVVAGRPALFRIAGALEPGGHEIDADTVQAMVGPILPPRLAPVLERDGSCDFAFDHPEFGRFRANVTRQRTGLKVSLRLVRRELPTLASLGLPASLANVTHHHQGIVVLTGATGHGKTTTLAALVDIFNRETSHHVITVEDPVEYVFPSARAMISQREVGSNTKSFASALKGSLREDPDVIVIGELRDTETVRMALSAGETGHLVLGTMNTPNAAKTIDRLIDLFPPAEQQQVRISLAASLRLIVSQTLVPSVDGKSSVAAMEILPGSVPLSNLIRDNKTFQIPSLQQRGKSMGIVRLDESLADLVKTGRTSREAALAVAESPDELMALLDKKDAPAVAPPPKADEKGVGGMLGGLFGKRT